MLWESVVDKFREPVTFIIQLLSLSVDVPQFCIHYFFVDLWNKCDDKVEEHNQLNDNAHKPNKVNYGNSYLTINPINLNIVKSWIDDVADRVAKRNEEVCNKTVQFWLGCNLNSVSSKHLENESNDNIP